MFSYGREESATCGGLTKASDDRSARRTSRVGGIASSSSVMALSSAAGMRTYLTDIVGTLDVTPRSTFAALHSLVIEKKIPLVALCAGL